MSTKNERREPHMTSSDTTSPILITGATGRHGGTGTYLARRLREAGRSVRALVRRLDERTAPLQALGAEIPVVQVAHQDLGAEGLERPARPGEPGSGPGGRRIGLLHVSGQQRHR